MLGELAAGLLLPTGLQGGDAELSGQPREVRWAGAGSRMGKLLEQRHAADRPIKRGVDVTLHLSEQA